MTRRRTILIVVLLIAAVGGGIWLWEEVLEDRLVPKRLGTVEQGRIYRSGQLHPALVERTLRDLGIEVIVDLDPDDTPAAAAELVAADKLGIEINLFPLIGDGTGDIEQYALAIQRIASAQQAQQPVLVHCAAGTYRTGGVVAMYRVLVEGWTPERAKAEMFEYDLKRKDTRIMVYLNEHMRTLAQRLVELGVIDAVPEPLPRIPID